MKIRFKIVAGVVSGLVAVLLLFLVFYRRRKRQLLVIPNSQTAPLHQTQSQSQPISSTFHASLTKLQRSLKSQSAKASMFFQNKNDREHSVPQPPLHFSWTDHPELVNDASETGWSRFLLTHQLVVSSPNSVLWSVYDGGAPRDAVETDWEVPLGSSEFMQTIRINSSGTSGICSVRMCLPLPGPTLAVSSFPEDAYFEITVLYLKMLPMRAFRTSKRSKVSYSGGEGDKVKLIDGRYNSERSANASAQDLAIDVHSDVSSPRQGDSGAKDEYSKGMVSVGLTVGGSLPSKSFAGTYLGSIGFNSDGSVAIDGMKLVFESEKTQWGEVNKVIGCGFEPSKKKVYFTLDSQLVHSITCKSEAYAAPLYPVLAASCDVLLQVNLGQGKFSYQPANSRRTTNPCFLRSTSTDSEQSSRMSCDSRELFSVGRMSQNGKTSNVKYIDANIYADTDIESDLFEIPLH